MKLLKQIFSSPAAFALIALTVFGCSSGKQDPRDISKDTANKLTENIKFDEEAVVVPGPKPVENTAPELLVSGVVIPEQIQFNQKFDIAIYTDYSGGDVAGAVMYIPPATDGYIKISGTLEEVRPSVQAGILTGSNSRLNVLGSTGKYVMRLTAVLQWNAAYNGKIPKFEFALFKQIAGGVEVGNYVSAETRLPDSPDGGTIQDAGTDASMDAGADSSYPEDASYDAGKDAGQDAGPDGSSGDASFDAGEDAGTDGGYDGFYPPDASMDAGPDGGFDGGTDGGMFKPAAMAGIFHTCALKPGGVVKCWGRNTSGQLGDGTYDSKNTPVDVIGLAGPAMAITAGGEHTCALLADTTIQCWGKNNSGQLGDGTNAGKPNPVFVCDIYQTGACLQTLIGAVAVTSGKAHTCAQMNDGRMKCWGYNDKGQLGDGTTTMKLNPTLVCNNYSGSCLQYLAGVQSISAGTSHSCAGMADGTARCWGFNMYGQLGDGTIGAGTDKLTPVSVCANYSGSCQTVQTQVSSITAGEMHTCAIINGGAKCWGNNNDGQLGDGTGGYKPTPVNVLDMPSGVSIISAGGRNTCAVKDDILRCWGSNTNGQVGDNSTTERNVPVDVYNLISSNWFVNTGSYHACAVHPASGQILCWGGNDYGQLGIGITGNKVSPMDVYGLQSGVMYNSSGIGHACASNSDGGICWGGNSSGQLGNGTKDSSDIPMDVSGLAVGIAGMSCGGSHSCAVISDYAYCWGENLQGQVGDGTNIMRLLPTQVCSAYAGYCFAFLYGINRISTGYYHTCAQLSDMTVKCWGNNLSYQLGNGTTTGSNLPVNVCENYDGGSCITQFSGAYLIAAGNTHTCATVQLDGTVRCWGNNTNGQLGDGTNDSAPTPTKVCMMDGGSCTDLLKSASNICTGGGHTCAVVPSGVKCWGYNYYGQLGDGTDGPGTNRNMPVDVQDLIFGVNNVACGNNHTCAHLSTGGVKCWGLNDVGQLGDGTHINKNTAVEVLGLSSGVSDISAGGNSTCARLNTGALKCWGNNSYGQLGDGEAWVSIPVVVQFTGGEIAP